jgi:nucleoside 2-deoxyribosyltransferase
MQDYRVYLAGSMSDVSFESSNIWRETAKKYLENKECNYHVSATNPNNFYNFLTKRYDSEEEIRRFDIRRVEQSDLILVNLDGKSIGTAMELQHAFDLGKAIIGYKTDGEKLHPWL